MTSLADVGKFVLDLLLSGLIAIAPSLPYFSQYKIIRASGHPGSFSPVICFTLLYGQGLRIFFWYAIMTRFGKFFDFPLLLQSVILLFTQSAMISVCYPSKKHVDDRVFLGLTLPKSSVL